MYIPSKYEITDEETQIELIKKHPLGVLISSSDDGRLVANHIPFVYKEDDNMGTLIAHLSGVNAQIEDLEKSESCLIVFQGANSYISPSWYPSKKETHKFVPTWDFAAVHVYGKPKILRDQAFKHKALEELTDQEENKIELGPDGSVWKLEEAPESYRQLKMKSIVGLHITIEKIEGKWKFEQKTKDTDIKGTIEGLKLQGTNGEKVAELVHQCNFG